MDPGANLAEQLRLADRIMRRAATGQDVREDAERLAELVEALDAWLCDGGALPRSWRKGRRA